MGVWGCEEGRGRETDSSLEICTYISFTLLLPELILVLCINCGCGGRKGRGVAVYYCMKTRRQRFCVKHPVKRKAKR